MKTKKTKTELVKTHLITHKQINTWDAIKLYKATRLSSIIFVLRKSGYNIKSVPLNIKDGGENVKYVNYVLVKNK
jgi:hypothetical protein